MKTLKFRTNLVGLVKRREKTSTWRLFDDKNLSIGDELELVEWETKQPFGTAVITKVVEKPLGQLSEADKEGHEKFESDEAMYVTYSGYYSTAVDADTLVKLIWFELK